MTAEEKRLRLRRFEELCRTRGLAFTVQRRRILELILDRKDHPTADQMYEDAKKHLPNVSRTTVYRVLETLVAAGAITKASSPGAATRFDPTTQRHHHLVCLHCDKLIDLDDRDFNHRVALPATRSRSFEIQDFSIHFHGICAACRKRLRNPSTTKAISDSPHRATANRRKPTRGRGNRPRPE